MPKAYTEGPANGGSTTAVACRFRLVANHETSDVEALRSTVAALEKEIDALRRRLADAPLRMRQLEERLLETKGLLAQEAAKNEKLSFTLREAREHIANLRDEVDKLSQPGIKIDLNL